MTTEAQHHYETWPGRIKSMKEAAPAIGSAFGGMFQKLMSEGALSVREKEMIAVAIGMALRCDECVYAHVEKAVKFGATREQLIEVAGVVVTMQGGPGYVHVPMLLDTLDALGVKASGGEVAHSGG
ncbi:MAG: carboxymuconolactone decarboxylase family protein [Phycisphaerales bacterium]|nr:carboxymuconolactone decarboxylase family protein [Phycisphaerales bacterium]